MQRAARPQLLCGGTGTRLSQPRIGQWSHAAARLRARHAYEAMRSKDAVRGLLCRLREVRGKASADRTRSPADAAPFWALDGAQQQRANARARASVAWRRKALYAPYDLLQKAAAVRVAPRRGAADATCWPRAAKVSCELLTVVTHPPFRAQRRPSSHPVSQTEVFCGPRVPTAWRRCRDALGASSGTSSALSTFRSCTQNQTASTEEMSFRCCALRSTA